MLLVVGRIGRAHGIKGEVSVEVRTDDPELRMGCGAVLVTDPAAVGPLTVTSVRLHSGRMLLAFQEVGDRSAAEALRGTFLLAEVDPQARPEADDEWYDHQLVGLQAVLADGTPIGAVREVLHLPGHDLLAVERVGGGEVLIPFVTAIVPVVDVPGNRVVVSPPPGLLDDAPGA